MANSSSEMAKLSGQSNHYGGTPEPEPEEEKFDWWNDFDAKAVFIIGNMTMALTLLEFVYAMLTGSLTLVADAFHRLSDVLTMACTFYAIILSHKPQSSKYSCKSSFSLLLSCLWDSMYASRVVLDSLLKSRLLCIPPARLSFSVFPPLVNLRVYLPRDVLD